MIANFVDGHGGEKSAFLRTFNSPGVRRALQKADEAQRQFTIASVPTLVVAGKYLVTMDKGRKTALEVVDYLITLEKSGRNTTENN